MIKINIDKAKDITKERLRTEREPKFAELDIEMMKYWSDPVKLAEIDTQKQVLRDITNLAETATTLDELKALKVE